MHLIRTTSMGSVSYRTGNEGPRHDPYHYEEMTVERDGQTVTLHMGLGTYVSHNGQSQHLDDRQALAALQRFAGVSYKSLMRALQRKPRMTARQRWESEMAEEADHRLLSYAM